MLSPSDNDTIVDDIAMKIRNSDKTCKNLYLNYLERNLSSEEALQEFIKYCRGAVRNERDKRRKWLSVLWRREVPLTPDVALDLAKLHVWLGVEEEVLARVGLKEIYRLMKENSSKRDAKIYFYFRHMGINSTEIGKMFNLRPVTVRTIVYTIDRKLRKLLGDMERN